MKATGLCQPYQHSILQFWTNSNCKIKKTDKCSKTVKFDSSDQTVNCQWFYQGLLWVVFNELQPVRDIPQEYWTIKEEEEPQITISQTGCFIPKWTNFSQNVCKLSAYSFKSFSSSFFFNHHYSLVIYKIAQRVNVAETMMETSQKFWNLGISRKL